jgi:glutamate 5-kinase
MAKKTIVIKIGTSSICEELTHFPRLSSLSLLVETIFQLRKTGYQVIVVSSGAIGMGLRKLNMSLKPKNLSQIQVFQVISIR